MHLYGTCYYHSNSEKFQGFSSVGLWGLRFFWLFLNTHFLVIFSLYCISKLSNKSSAKFSLTLKHHSKISNEVFGYFSEIKGGLNMKTKENKTKKKDFVRSFLGGYIFFLHSHHLILFQTDMGRGRRAQFCVPSQWCV